MRTAVCSMSEKLNCPLGTEWSATENKSWTEAATSQPLSSHWNVAVWCALTPERNGSMNSCGRWTWQKDHLWRGRIHGVKQASGGRERTRGKTAWVSRPIAFFLWVLALQHGLTDVLSSSAVLCSIWYQVAFAVSRHLSLHWRTAG